MIRYLFGKLLCLAWWQYQVGSRRPSWELWRCRKQQGAFLSHLPQEPTSRKNFVLCRSHSGSSWSALSQRQWRAPGLPRNIPIQSSQHRRECCHQDYTSRQCPRNKNRSQKRARRSHTACICNFCSWILLCLCSRNRSLCSLGTSRNRWERPPSHLHLSCDRWYMKNLMHPWTHHREGKVSSILQARSRTYKQM